MFYYFNLAFFLGYIFICVSCRQNLLFYFVVLGFIVNELSSSMCFQVKIMIDEMNEYYSLDLSNGFLCCPQEGKKNKYHIYLNLKWLVYEFIIHSLVSVSEIWKCCSFSLFGIIVNILNFWTDGWTEKRNPGFHEVKTCNSTLLLMISLLLLQPFTYLVKCQTWQNLISRTFWNRNC